MELKEKLNITINELNQQSHFDFQKARPDMLGTEYDRPGGFCYRQWDKFIANYQDGDEIWLFESSWAQLAGRRGYAIVRNSTVIDSFCTEIS